MKNANLQSSSSTIVPYAWVILGSVYLASIAAPLNQLKAPPILPVLMQVYQINLTQAGLLISVIAMVGLVLALPSGIILRRFGPRPTGMIALGFIGAGSVFGALSSSYGTLLGSRVVEGVGVGLMGVVAPATIAMWFPLARQGMPMGIWAT